VANLAKSLTKPFSLHLPTIFDHFRPFSRAGGLVNRLENQGSDHFPRAWRR
jgi:hypothetical protein